MLSGLARTQRPSVCDRPRVSSTQAEIGCSRRLLKSGFCGTPAAIALASTSAAGIVSAGVTRCRVSVMMFSGLTGAPKILLATSATIWLRWAREPWVDMVAEVPMHSRLLLRRSRTRRTSMATSAP
ncbi:hypothetical protein D3C84_927240 [compost metagenome]